MGRGWRRLARAAEAVAGGRPEGPVGLASPWEYLGSAAPPGAARRALRRRRSRAAALPRGDSRGAELGGALPRLHLVCT